MQHKLTFLYCIIHQHVLCKSVLKIIHAIDVVTKIVNFIRARALNHRQFVALLEEHETEHSDIGYHTALRWLSSPGPYVAATSPVGLKCLFYAMCKNQLLIV